LNGHTALVTGAAGFIGRWLVNALASKGFCVRAGVRDLKMSLPFSHLHRVEPVYADILNADSLVTALQGVDHVYHFAALVDAKASPEWLYKINVEGTKNLWNCAVACDVKAALYCSSTAVYGLLAGSHQPVTEQVKARAVEHYGRSKLLGETAALEIGARLGLPTVVIRPAAVFGPGGNTGFERNLRRAAFTKLLLAGSFYDWKFNYVHVEDVAEVSIHLMQGNGYSGQIFNVVVEEPLSLEDAFRSYMTALSRANRTLWLPKLIAAVSLWVNKLPLLSSFMARSGRRLIFNLRQPGFDMLYSSGKLMETSFRLKWTNFEEVILSCINEIPNISVKQVSNPSP
jgi:nucleoside-diphosphate-sugar epimerase